VSQSAEAGVGVDPGQLMVELERLLAEVEAQPDARVKERTRAVVRAVLALHGAGLKRMQALLTAQGAPGFAALAAFAKDPLVQSLLLLHDLHPEPFEARVASGLSKVDAFMRLNASRAELLSTQEGQVKVRIVSDGPLTRTTPEKLRQAVEQALVDSAPDAAAVEIELQGGA